jgi:hypothetical protein
MCNIKLWLAAALLAAFVFAGAGVSQPPEPKTGLPPLPPFPPTAGRLGVDDIVERIMAFDKNKDGKVTKDELPERMHHLITMGDTNKDGALDRDEIKKLVVAYGGSGPAGGFGITGGAAGGFGAAGGLGDRVAVGTGPVTVGQIRVGPGVGGIEGIVDDLKLAGKKKDEARSAVKTHQENVRKLMDQARAELLQKMKVILNEEEFNDFKAALDRPGGGETFFNFGPQDGPRPKR